MEPITGWKLENGEVVIHDEGVSHFHNFIAVGGRLRLTNQRMTFCSNSGNNYHHKVIIDLSDIAAVEFFKTMLINPNGMAIMLKSGNMENFIVDDRKAWRERIMACLAQTA